MRTVPAVDDQLELALVNGAPHGSRAVITTVERHDSPVILDNETRGLFWANADLTVSEQLRWQLC